MKFNLNIKKYVFVGAAILCLSTSSCINDLDQNPIIDKGQSEIINESDCQSFLAKIYSGFGLSGNVGPSGGVQDLQGPIRVLYVSCADCCPLSYTLPMKPFGTGKMKV